MAKTEPEIHQDCVNRFIEMANVIKDEGVDIKLISSALMSASSVYETFIHVGNQGGLTPSGVDKATAKYKKHMERCQEIRKMEDEQRNANAGN